MRRLRNADRSDVEVGVFRDGAEGRFKARLGREELARARRKFSNRFAFLIHGWKVRVEEQAACYGRLLSRVGDLDDSLETALLTVSWPSRDRYRPALDAAKLTAQALSELMQDSRYPFTRSREITLIGHSMGCRVALELAAILTERNFAPRLRLHLMAAAVPVALVENGPKLNRAVAGCEHAAVYYSMTDQAFLLPFQVVESWADAGQGLFPEPVGRHGNPISAWQHRRSLAPCSHGGYWKSSVVAGDIVSDFRRTEIRRLPIR